MPRGYPGLTPGVDPRSQGMIPRRFKRKKNFVTNGRTDGWTDRHVGRNSDLDMIRLRGAFLISITKQNGFWMFNDIF